MKKLSPEQDAKRRKSLQKDLVKQMRDQNQKDGESKTEFNENIDVLRYINNGNNIIDSDMEQSVAKGSHNPSTW